MELIQIRCPNCGGNLMVNPKKEILECKYCHTELLLNDGKKEITINKNIKI